MHETSALPRQTAFRKKDPQKSEKKRKKKKRGTQEWNLERGARAKEKKGPSVDGKGERGSLLRLLWTRGISSWFDFLFLVTSSTSLLPPYYIFGNPSPSISLFLRRRSRQPACLPVERILDPVFVLLFGPAPLMALVPPPFLPVSLLPAAAAARCFCCLHPHPSRRRAVWLLLFTLSSLQTFVSFCVPLSL